MAKWVSDNNAKPPVFHTLMIGRKEVATVRRIGGKRDKAGRWHYQYQFVRRWVDPVGGGIGPVFTTLAKAKRYVEGRL